MTPGAGVVQGELEQVADALRGHDRFLLTTHENPDGDALGSLLSTHQILRSLGKDSVMFLAAKEFPLPIEYRFLPLEEVFHEPPTDMADRVVVFLDCGNADRMPVDFLHAGDLPVLNVDHHHDNTRFGTINLVDVSASSTAEMVFELAGALAVNLTPEIATALYVGLVTDTGRFMYQNTTARTHRTAAALIEAGVDVHDIFRRLYEHVPLEKLKLIARAIERIELIDEGAIAITYISSDDYAEIGATDVHTEGVIDYVRSLNGAAVAGVVRDQGPGAKGARKVSLRSTDGRVDVSEIARKQGGGGHRRAAGFATDLAYPEVIDFIRREVAAQI